MRLLQLLYILDNVRECVSVGINAVRGSDLRCGMHCNFIRVLQKKQQT